MSSIGAKERSQALRKVLFVLYHQSSLRIQQERRHFGTMVGMRTEQHRFPPDRRLQEIMPSHRRQGAPDKGHHCVSI